MKICLYDELNDVAQLRALGDVLLFWVEGGEEEVPDYAKRKFFEVSEFAQRYDLTDVLSGLLAFYCREELIKHCMEMLFLEDGEFYTFKACTGATT